MDHGEGWYGIFFVSIKTKSRNFRSAMGTFRRAVYAALLRRKFHNKPTMGEKKGCAWVSVGVNFLFFGAIMIGGSCLRKLF